MPKFALKWLKIRGELLIRAIIRSPPLQAAEKGTASSKSVW
jgi:hypothetical protein